jgi:hypothetical protein
LTKKEIARANRKEERGVRDGSGKVYGTVHADDKDRDKKRGLFFSRQGHKTQYSETTEKGEASIDTNGAWLDSA